MSAHDDRLPTDELARRYHEANAQDMRRPGAHVRQAVQAHAQAVLAARQGDAPLPPAVAPEASNQPRWKMSMLASIALAGLTGLLVLQFDRGTPEEKELAMGQPRANAPSPSSSPAPAAQEAAPAAPPGKSLPPAAVAPVTPPLAHAQKPAAIRSSRHLHPRPYRLPRFLRPCRLRLW